MTDSIIIADSKIGTTIVSQLEQLAFVSREVPLAKLSRWRIGGLAPVVVEPSTVSELCQVQAYLNSNSIPHLVVGYTSNLLFSDEPANYVIIRIAEKMSKIRIDGEFVEVEAGTWGPRLAMTTARAGLYGLEHIVGIPGTVGGLVCMNGGSKRQSIGTHVACVTCVAADGRLTSLPQEACGFGYRTSIFQDQKLIVVSAKLKLGRGTWEQTRRTMLRILRERSAKFPRKTPNCGSVFVSAPQIYETHGPSGALIESVGLKGARYGNAEISNVHANFIVNRGGATAREVLALIAKARLAVYSRYGHWMKCEVKFVAPCGRITPAHMICSYSED